MIDASLEWLETDGLGGYASGTALGLRTRRYHALLLAATRPPADRFVLVSGFDARLESSSGTFALTSQRYAPDVVYPDGLRRIEKFEAEPWPTWSLNLEDGTRIEHEILVPRGGAVTVVTWRFEGAVPGARLVVRPFLSGRDPHLLRWPGARQRLEMDIRGGRIVWSTEEDAPAVVCITNGDYAHRPDLYRSFLYREEVERGLDSVEDLVSPGELTWDIDRGEAIWVVAADGHDGGLLPAGQGALALADDLRDRERRRRSTFGSRLERAADAYIVRRGAGETIIAGYPWFGDWGRDTFIALRGLCLATGRIDHARRILLEWSGAVSEGMLPNRFPDHGQVAEYNAVDASLWFVIAVDELISAAARAGRPLPGPEVARLAGAIAAILDGYEAGTRFGIRADGDGLLAVGAPGMQLTWMDAKVGDWVVTPRAGKPVEVQALWINALAIGARFDTRWEELLARAASSFEGRFWSDERGHLYDVVDVDGRAGAVDHAFRPNQVFAVGGLPRSLVPRERARRVIDSLEARLWTPLGLRTLARGEPGYRPRYEGDVKSRDGAYHQGTVWPWLAGPFVEAWVRARGASAEVKQEARGRFLPALLKHLEDGGLGHVSEVVDAEPPFTPRGCPFQAWSVGELLRLDRVVLA